MVTPARVFDALEQRIFKQGDMPIRVYRETLRTLLRAVGLRRWELGDDAFREIDALALSALLFLARSALTGEQP